MKKNELFFLLMLIIGCAMLLGMFLLLSINSKADETTEDITTESIYTSEEQEALDKAKHLSDQEHDDILNASSKFLDTLDSSMLSTPSSASYDDNFYLSSDEAIFTNTDQTFVMLDYIYRMLISIRNCLLLFFFAIVCAWFHKNLKNIISRFSGRGRV